MQRFIAVIILFIIFSSCSNKTATDLAVYRSMQAGFIQSATAVDLSNKEIYLAIEGRAKDLRVASYAAKWQPGALLIKDFSNNAVNYIDSLLSELKIEAGVKLEEFGATFKETYREDDKDAVERVFIKNNRGKALQERLLKYKNDMLAIDPELFKTFEHIIINVSDSFFKKGFTETYFKDVPAVAALALLKKFQSDIVNNENQFLRFCLNKTHPVMIIDDFPMPLISQSSSYVRQGDEIVITAGIGSYATALKTSVMIGNKLISDNGEGVVTYKFKANGHIGKNKIPIRLVFLDYGTGRKDTVVSNIEYSIIE